GLDHPLRILTEAAAHLTGNGVLVLEVGLSRAALERALPRLEAVWVELEQGGEGVAVITRAVLDAPDALRAAA
ncbi:MAG: 50S ribosomal protein L3 N(5)-glutamine methyltransferase, partial [Gammaproteobacteria bacterium]